MAAVETIQRVTVQGRSEGLDRLTSDLNAVSGAQERVAQTSVATAQITDTSAKRQLSMANALERLRAQIDPVARAEQGLARGTAILDKALQQGIINMDAYGRHLDLLKTKYRDALPGNDNRPASLAPHQAQNLAYQVGDIFSSLSTGASPLTVLMQQGPQILQIFGPGTGVLGVFRGLASAIAGLITPITATIGGLAALGVAAIAAYSQFSSAQKEMEQSLKAVGAATGTTVEGLNRVAEQAAISANISNNSARSMAAAYAATGKIGVDSIGGIIAITERFAKTTGQDVADATKQLAEAFADPVKGAEDLNSKLGFLDDRTAELIQSLYDMNDKTGAQKALMDALIPSIDQAAQATTLLGQAWDYVKGAAVGAWEAMGRAISTVINGAPLAKQIADLTQRRGDLQSALDANGFQAMLAGGEMRREIAQINTELDKLQRQAATQDLAAGLKKAQIDANAASREVGAYVRSLDPIQKQYDDLSAKESMLRKALEDPFIQSRTDMEGVKRSLEAVIGARKSLLDVNGQLYTSESLKAAQDKLAIDMAKATTEAEKGRIAAEQKRLELVGKVISPTDRAGQISRASQLASAQEAAKGAGQADEFDRMTKRIEDQTRKLDEQAATFGRTAGEVARYRAEQELLTAAQRAGREITPELKNEIDGYADALAAATTRLEELRKRQDAINDVSNYFGSTLTDAISDLELEGKSLADVFDNVARSIAKAALQAAILGQGPLAGLFGTSGANGSPGGLIGAALGGLKSLFGGSSFQSFSIDDVTMPSSFSGLYDSGGTIPSGRWGVVGERRPEIVMGPATVIPKFHLAGAANDSTSGGAAPIQLTYAPTIDARGSSITEGQIAALLAENNRALRQALPRMIADARSRTQLR